MSLINCTYTTIALKKGGYVKRRLSVLGHEPSVLNIYDYVYTEKSSICPNPSYLIGG